MIALALAVPLLFALAGLLLPASRRWQVPVGTVGAFLLLGVNGVLLARAAGGDIESLALGSWAAPWGIVLVLDLTAAIFLFTCALGTVSVALFAAVHPLEEPLGRWYFPLQNFLVLGVNGALLTGDLFNLFVWFELMLIASFVLMVVGGRRDQLEGGLKYVVINLVASAIFLTGVGVIYGKTGTLNLADLATLVGEGGETARFVRSGTALVFGAFGVKAGLFPLFFWLPASYHTPAPIVTALFAGLLTKVGVYAFFRVTTLFLRQDFPAWQGVFVWVAILTMVTGVLGAAAQFQMRKILSFHIISQVGYLLAGLAMFTPLGLAAGLFYFVHNNLAKTNLLLVSAWVEHRRGTADLARLGGLYRSSLPCTVIFLISALALAGVPPLSGFWAKLAVVRAGLEAGHYAITAAALAVGLLTLFSMTKIWAEAFWKADPEVADEDGGGPSTTIAESDSTDSPWSLLPMAIPAVAIVALSLFGQPVFDLTLAAADQLLDPRPYIETVLGDAAAPPAASPGQ